MNRCCILTSLAVLSTVLLQSGIIGSAEAVTIDTVPVGNVGNANDPATGGLYGGVAYAYRIGKTEVTIGQYTEFLNAVAKTDTYALYNTSMATDLNIAGILRSGVSPNYSYGVIGSANHPVSYVSWGDAARFANWLHNGQPMGLQDATTTEDGAYTLNGAVRCGRLNTVTRNAGAKWFIPSENEWYKAAYHQPPPRPDAVTTGPTRPGPTANPIPTNRRATPASKRTSLTSTATTDWPTATTTVLQSLDPRPSVALRTT